MQTRTGPHIVKSTRRVLLLVGSIALLIAETSILDMPRARAADPKANTVALTVDYGDGAQVCFKTLPWRDGMTVLDAIAAAEKHPHGIKVARRGRGTSALITEIGGLKNEGDGKNWLYSVNGKMARLGAGAYQLESGDVVLWEFKVYDYN